MLVERNEDGTANYTITSQTVYVRMGRITLVSTPRRSTGETSDGWKRTTADELGRVVELATFTGAAQPPNSGTDANWTGSVTTSFYANETTVTDQAGKSRRSVTDALGRLAQVIEDPGGAAYLTTYQYDSRGNLTQTSQTGIPNGGSTSITPYDTAGNQTSDGYSGNGARVRQDRKFPL